METYAFAAFVVALSVLWPMLVCIAYVVLVRPRLQLPAKFVLLGSWLSYGVLGSMTVLAAPVVFALEPLLEGACNRGHGEPQSLSCIAGTWIYDSGWMVALALWVVLSLITIHALAVKHWKSLANIWQVRHES
jgi:hypothetical protein